MIGVFLIPPNSGELESEDTQKLNYTRLVVGD